MVIGVKLFSKCYNGGMTLKYSDRVVIYLRKRVLEEVEVFQKREGYSSRSEAIKALIERALREETEKEKGA